ncbi:hypothetical protein NBRC116587_24400 [Pseudoteredinibacter isoporae]
MFIRFTRIQLNEVGADDAQLNSIHAQITRYVSEDFEADRSRVEWAPLLYRGVCGCGSGYQLCVMS